MKIALDTNVILRYVHRDDVQHQLVTQCLRKLVGQAKELCIAPQGLYEFWVVATRPVEVNGLGFTPGTSRRHVNVVIEAFTVLSEPSDLLERWLDLCSYREIRGRQAHDARLVAWMLGNHLDRLLTFNAGDFRRYEEIECLHPGNVPT